MRALDDFGHLWYALGFDVLAASSFRAAVDMADSLSALDDARALGLARAGVTATDQLRKLGSGHAVPGAELRSEVKDLLETYERSCGVVDVDHLPSNQGDGHLLKAA